MLTAQLAASMDDEHLLASARAEIDPLTSTALELELLERFERLLDEDIEFQISILGERFRQHPEALAALKQRLDKAESLLARHN